THSKRVEALRRNRGGETRRAAHCVKWWWRTITHCPSSRVQPHSSCSLPNPPQRSTSSSSSSL
ncbi:unnamed protein product, partial [Closterium sp. Yama58-4]